MEPESVSSSGNLLEKVPKENPAKNLEAGKLKIFFVDECHLSWGDACGFVWGPTEQRIELAMKNEKQKQTHGALDYVTGKVIVQPYPNGNTDNTINLVQQLIKESTKLQQAEQIVIIWDGAPYHRSQQFLTYLKQLNQGKKEQQWLVKCVRLASNGPEQNPIEHV